MNYLNFYVSNRKVFLLLLISTIFLNACEEKFNHQDPKLFNAQLALNNSIESPEGLIKHYYQLSDEVESHKITITTEPLGNTKYSITLIHDYLTDDSQKAKKIILIASKEKRHWNVHNIKTNFKCWPNRGHQRWGITPCE